MQKVLLLLEGGLVLGLSARPDKYFKVAKGVSREWRRINQRTLRESIKKLYRSKLVDCGLDENGDVVLVLNNEGQKKILKYKPEVIKIKRPQHWDRLWRVVIFDIPENQKRARDAISIRLKHAGFYPLQKSVFIHPFDCKNEVDFLVELFEIRPYVRFLLVKETDIDLDLKTRFHL